MLCRRKVRMFWWNALQEEGEGVMLECCPVGR